MVTEVALNPAQQDFVNRLLHPEEDPAPRSEVLDGVLHDKRKRIAALTIVALGVGGVALGTEVLPQSDTQSHPSTEAPVTLPATTTITPHHTASAKDKTSANSDSHRAMEKHSGAGVIPGGKIYVPGHGLVDVQVQSGATLQGISETLAAHDHVSPVVEQRQLESQNNHKNPLLHSQDIRLTAAQNQVLAHAALYSPSSLPGAQGASAHDIQRLVKPHELIWTDAEHLDPNHVAQEVASINAASGLTARAHQLHVPVEKLDEHLIPGQTRLVEPIPTTAPRTYTHSGSRRDAHSGGAAGTPQVQRKRDQHTAPAGTQPAPANAVPAPGGAVVAPPLVTPHPGALAPQPSTTGSAEGAPMDNTFHLKHGAYTPPIRFARDLGVAPEQSVHNPHKRAQVLHHSFHYAQQEAHTVPLANTEPAPKHGHETEHKAKEISLHKHLTAVGRVDDFVKQTLLSLHTHKYLTPTEVQNLTDQFIPALRVARMPELAATTPGAVDENNPMQLTLASTINQKLFHDTPGYVLNTDERIKISSLLAIAIANSPLTNKGGDVAAAVHEYGSIAHQAVKESERHAAVSTIDPKACSDHLRGGSVQQEIFNYYLCRGLPAVVAAGMVGQAGQESGFHTADPGGLLYQWGGGRLTAEEAYAHREHKSPTNLGAELDYSYAELTGAPGAAENDSAVLHAAEHAGSAAQAAVILSNGYERPGIPELGRREAFASHAMASFNNDSVARAARAHGHHGHAGGHAAHHEHPAPPAHNGNPPAAASTPNHEQHRPPHHHGKHKSRHAHSGRNHNNHNAHASLAWPFPKKNVPQQARRPDQGKDLQENKDGEVLALADGTMFMSNPDPGGFGDNYPTEKVDHHIPGLPTNYIYYGHTHMTVPNGAHVHKGEVIARTNAYYGQDGSDAPPGWVEIGPSINSHGIPVNAGAGATPGGLAMQHVLLSDTHQVHHHHHHH